MNAEMVNDIPGFYELFVAVLVFSYQNPSTPLALSVVFKFKLVLVSLERVEVLAILNLARRVSLGVFTVAFFVFFEVFIFIIFQTHYRGQLLVSVRPQGSDSY